MTATISGKDFFSVEQCCRIVPLYEISRVVRITKTENEIDSVGVWDGGIEGPSWVQGFDLE